MNIVSVAPFVPFEGIAHAGGEYYLRHVRALTDRGHRVRVIAPGITANRLAEPPAGVDVILVDEGASRWHRGLAHLQMRVRQARPSLGFSRAAIRNPQVRSLLQSADLLELQWTQMALTAPVLRRLMPSDRPAVCIAHDVISQGLDRQAEVPGLDRRRRVVRRLRAIIGAHDERRALQFVDHIFTFSAKDRDILSERFQLSSVHVLHPSLEPPVAGPKIERGTDDEIALFVGAFDRPENADAAEWLLETIWPAILRSRPDARLILAGDSPTSRMRDLAGQTPSVEVTGYVADLTPIYHRAKIALAPIRLGAGVKFKVITAMFYGLPVIATPAGAEGIGSNADFVAITDEPNVFAEAVVRAMTDKVGSDLLARRAQAFVRATYGAERFSIELEGYYKRLLNRVDV